MKTTKKLLCILLAMLTMLAFLSATAAAADPEPDEVSFKVVFNLNRIGDGINLGAFRFCSLVIIPYVTPQSNYRLQVNRVEINEDNALEVFAEGKYIGDGGATVMGTGLLLLYVPLKDVKGTNGVILALET